MSSTSDVPSSVVWTASHSEPQCSLFGTGSKAVNPARHWSAPLLSPKSRNKVEVNQRLDFRYDKSEKVIRLVCSFLLPAAPWCCQAQSCWETSPVSLLLSSVALRPSLCCSAGLSSFESERVACPSGPIKRAYVCIILFLNNGSNLLILNNNTLTLLSHIQKENTIKERIIQCLCVIKEWKSFKTLTGT